MDIKYESMSKFDLDAPTGAVKADVGRTILILVSHSDNNANGSICVIVRLVPGRAGPPLVAAIR